MKTTLKESLGFTVPALLLPCLLLGLQSGGERRQEPILGPTRRLRWWLTRKRRRTQESNIDLATAA